MKEASHGRLCFVCLHLYKTSRIGKFVVSVRRVPGAGERQPGWEVISTHGCLMDTGVLVGGQRYFGTIQLQQLHKMGECTKCG